MVQDKPSAMGAMHATSGRNGAVLRTVDDGWRIRITSDDQT